MLFQVFRQFPRVILLDLCVRTPPPEPTTKANYDGALFQYSGEVGVGIVIQSHLDLVLASVSKNMALPSSVEAVEFLVAVHALQLASDCGFSTFPLLYLVILKLWTTFLDAKKFLSPRLAA